MELEFHDSAILRALQESSRISNQELADKVGMSASACWRRVKALEDAGIIRGYKARIDAKASGMSFQAIAHVQLARHNPDFLKDFISTMSAAREVLDCFATTGEADYHLRVLCRDLDAYNRFLEDVLFKIPGVANVRTNLVLREIKRDAPITF